VPAPSPRSARLRRACAALAALAAAASPAGAQPAAASAASSAASSAALPGYTPAASARQRALEASAVARPDPAVAERHARALSAEAHVAGTAAQARTRDYVVAELRRLGIPTEVRAYRVWLPHATSVAVTRLGAGGDTLALDLREPAVAGDAASALAQYPTVNGSSGAGAAEGELVYANYGLIDDYAVLDSLGVSVRGKVVVARYGRSFRGIKAREAERRGAVALLIYSDPADDGYARGDVYPEGPMRPPRACSAAACTTATAHPSTPGWPSTDGARRLPVGLDGVPRIPVVPISYGNARLLLEGVRGAGVPQPGRAGSPSATTPAPVRCARACA
jgi:N-acetylated-alpha-linked acidic dipeptidase